jgi:hypothetical protein
MGGGQHSAINGGRDGGHKISSKFNHWKDQPRPFRGPTFLKETSLPAKRSATGLNCFEDGMTPTEVMVRTIPKKKRKIISSAKKEIFLARKGQNPTTGLKERLIFLFPHDPLACPMGASESLWKRGTEFIQLNLGLFFSVSEKSVLRYRNVRQKISKEPNL